MPYNYLLDYSTRSSLHLQLANSVIIFDEAHNLETACADASSFEMTTADISRAVREVRTRVVDLEKKGQGREGVLEEAEMLSKLQEVLGILQNSIMKLPLTR